MTPKLKKRMVDITGVVGILTISLVVAGAGWKVYGSVSDSMSDTKHNTETIQEHADSDEKTRKDHERRIRWVEDTMIKVGSDVEWIRKTMEKAHP